MATRFTICIISAAVLSLHLTSCHPMQIGSALNSEQAPVRSPVQSIPESRVESVGDEPTECHPVLLAAIHPGLTLSAYVDSELTELSHFDTNVWDVATGKSVFTAKSSSHSQPESHMGGLEEVFFSPRGDLMVSVGTGGVYRIWETESGRPLRELGGYRYPVARVHKMAAVSSDSSTLLALYRPHFGLADVVTIWNIGSGRKVRVFSEYMIGGAAIAADGERFYLGWFNPETGQKQLSALETRTGRTIFSTKLIYRTRTPAAPEFDVLKTLSKNRLAIRMPHQDLEFRDSGRGDVLKTVAVPHDASMLQLSDDGRLALLTERYRSYFLLDTETGAQLLLSGDRESTITPKAAAFNLDHSRVSIAFSNGQLRQWSTQNGQEQLGNSCPRRIQRKEPHP